MRLTIFTDYTLRTLMYLGIHSDRLATIQDIADVHQISKSHLTKVVYELGMSGLVETVRGRNGGLRLQRAPRDINIGAVVRRSEPDFFMAACFGTEESTCAHHGNCRLTPKLAQATAAYLAVLDDCTLADLLPGQPGEHLLTFMRRPPRSASSPDRAE